jgi:hypothetical protein
MMARMGSQLEEMEAYLEKEEATVLEANPEEIESEAKHRKVPTEGTAMDTDRAQGF